MRCCFGLALWGEVFYQARGIDFDAVFRLRLRDVIRFALTAYGVDVARTAFAHGAAIDFFRRVEQAFQCLVDVVFRHGTARGFFAFTAWCCSFFARDVLLQGFFVAACGFFLAAVVA